MCAKISRQSLGPDALSKGPQTRPRNLAKDQVRAGRYTHLAPCTDKATNVILHVTLTETSRRLQAPTANKARRLGGNPNTGRRTVLTDLPSPPRALQRRSRAEQHFDENSEQQSEADDADPAASGEEAEPDQPADARSPSPEMEVQAMAPVRLLQLPACV
jgi:hypothetical protein